MARNTAVRLSRMFDASTTSSGSAWAGTSDTPSFRNTGLWQASVSLPQNWWASQATDVGFFSLTGKPRDFSPGGSLLGPTAIEPRFSAPRRARHSSVTPIGDVRNADG